VCLQKQKGRNKRRRMRDSSHPAANALDEWGQDEVKGIRKEKPNALEALQPYAPYPTPHTLNLTPYTE
jgi:hypothetical protein